MFCSVKKIVGVLILNMILMVGLVNANQTEEDLVQQAVQNAIEQVFDDIRVNREMYLQNNEAFYEALNNNLASVVDIEGITKSIMTVKYIKQANTEQIKQFEETFKRSLLKFYGSSLLTIGDVEIKYLSSKINDKDINRAVVNTEAKSGNGGVYPISYTMVKIDNNWFLRNVVVSGINIGKLFREQFNEQMKKNKNNIEKTIANWEQVVKAQQEQLDKDRNSGKSEAEQ